MTTITRPRQTAIGNTAGLRNEPCTKTVEEEQSQEPGQYMLTNFYGFCDVKTPRDIMLLERGNQMSNGYGVAMACNVDTDSHLRLDSTVTNPRLMHKLYTRPALTVPYMGRSNGGETDVESFLRVGYQTAEKRPCNILSEISIDVPRMDYEKWNCVQDPNHIVETGWVRGGAMSRNDVRRAQYNARCKYATSA